MGAPLNRVMDGRSARYCAIAALETAASSEVSVEVKAELQLLRNAHSDGFQVAIWRSNFDFVHVRIGNVRNSKSSVSRIAYACAYGLK